jgi:hypothetical protein
MKHLFIDNLMISSTSFASLNYRKMIGVDLDARVFTISTDNIHYCLSLLFEELFFEAFPVSVQ